jgi:hypothetical protein
MSDSGAVHVQIMPMEKNPYFTNKVTMGSGNC